MATLNQNATLLDLQAIASDEISPVNMRAISAAYRKALGNDWDIIEETDGERAKNVYLIVLAGFVELTNIIDRVNERVLRNEIVSDMYSDELTELEQWQKLEAEYECDIFTESDARALTAYNEY